MANYNQTEDLNADDKFFIKIQDGIFIPSENYTSENVLRSLEEKIPKRVSVIKLGVVKEVIIQGISFKEDNKTPFSFKYQVSSDNVLWERVIDFRKKVIEIASDKTKESYQKAIHWALSHPAKFTMYIEKRIKDYDKPDDEHLFVSLNDWVLKEKNKPPIKEITRGKSIQDIILGYETTPVCFQIAPSNTLDTEQSFITSIEPDPSEPSEEEEYDFFEQ